MTLNYPAQLPPLFEVSGFTDAMMVTPITDQLLNDAFELAYFILGDRPASVYVAMAAVDKLKAASTIQGRRQYYIPTGRSSYRASRTKVNLSEIHLLQRLVYVEAELFEQLLEGQQQPPRLEDLIIRYVKHLVRITTRHNSFYVALGLCRLLYNYTTAETAEIYNAVLQDPVRIRDDHYYRSRKKRLLTEMNERFGKLIRIQKGFRREERFQTEESSEQFANLVKDCLVRFTPWQSRCVLPEDLDPKRNLVPPLLFEGSDPDKEHEIELNRIHTLIHPGCLEKLTTALKIDPPDQRLEIPHFFTSGDLPPLDRDRFKPAKLSAGEMNAIRRHLDKNSMHRRTFQAADLICLIDQQRVGVFDPAETPNVVFNMNANAELIEVRSLSDEAEIPLVLWPINHSQAVSHRLTSTAVLESGHQLKFRIDPGAYDSDGPPTTSLTISYQPQLRRKTISELFLGLNRWGNELNSSIGRRFYVPAFAVLLIAAIGAGGYLLLRRRSDPSPTTSQPVAGIEQMTPTSAASPNPSPSSDASDHTARLEKPGSTNRVIDEGDPEVTRGKSLRPRSIPLASVKRVFVDTIGEDQFSTELRDRLVTALQASSYFELTTDRKDADAVFQGSVIKPNNQRTWSVKLELVEISGRVIWSFRTTVKESANAPGLASQISEKLLRDVEASKSQ